MPKIPKFIIDNLLQYTVKIPMRYGVKKETEFGGIPKIVGQVKDYILDKNGEIVPGVRGIYPDTIKRVKAVNDIYNNYVKAMSRRRDYKYEGLKYHIDDGFTAIKDPDSNSLLIGFKEGPIFHPSHFAPETLRGGQRVVQQAAESRDPVVFTVTSDLSPMLERSGFIKVGQIPQTFNGQLVMKDIMANKATANVEEELSNHLTPYLKKFIDVNKIMQTIRDTPSVKSPYMSTKITNTFPLADLLKRLQQGGLILKRDNTKVIPPPCN